MPKASNLQVDKNASILFKGPTGFGKTLAAASFALEGELFLAYWDKKGPIELRNFFKPMGELGRKILNNIEYEIYSAKNANQFLNKLIDFSQSCRLAAFVNDSVTQMTSGAVNWSLSFRPERKDKDKLKVLPDFDEYKVETSLVTQALDICRSLPCHVIWTAHPVPGIKIEGSGHSIKVTKVNPIVTYGSKVAGIVPGNFSEIYHFSKNDIWDPALGKAKRSFIVSFDSIGDDYAKSNIGLSGEMDITDKLFYPAWIERVKAKNEEVDDAVKLNEEKERQASVEKQATVGNELLKVQFPTDPKPKWNSEKGIYE